VLPSIYTRARSPLGVSGYTALRPTRNENPSVTLPQTGHGPQWTTPVSPNWSAWIQVTAGEASDFILATLNINTLFLSATSWWIQLGIGASQNEAPIAEWSGTAFGTFSADYPLIGYYQFWLYGYKLVSNTRLVIRSRQLTVTDSNPYLGAVVVAMPSPPLFSADWDEETFIKGGVSGSLIYPAIPSFTSITSGAAINTYGTPVEMIASAPNRLLVKSIHENLTGTTNRMNRYQVGIGAKDAEKWHELGATPRSTFGTLRTIGNFILPRPVEVLKDERVAVRYNCSAAAQSEEISIDVLNLNF